TTTTTLPPDTTPPAMPTGLVASVIDCHQIDLAWDASSDTGGSGLAAYGVYGFVGNAGVLIERVPVSRTSTSAPGLRAATVYSYAVTAIDAAGNESPLSAWVAPGTPSCVTTTSVPATTSSTSSTQPPTTSSSSSTSSTSSSSSTSTSSSTSSSSTSTSSS